jgi:ABC-type multidrug transport system permease subunit
MLRTVFLIFQNEFRLLSKDRVGLFMLMLAPVTIIAVAGFSLGDIYSQPGDHAYTIPVVDQDHGAIAEAIIDALKREPSIAVAEAAGIDQASGIVITRDRAPLAILIPPGTTEAIRAGRPARIILYVDPAKRLEVTAIEVRLAELCRTITTASLDLARKKIAADGAALHSRLDRLAGGLKLLQSQIERFGEQAVHAQADTRRALKARMANAVREIELQTKAAVASSILQTKSALATELGARRDAMEAVSQYLIRLQSTEHEFDRWLAALKAAAGSHAVDIPQPPAFPEPPSKAQLAELSKPIELSIAQPVLPAPVVPEFEIKSLPMAPRMSGRDLLSEIQSLPPAGPSILPGDLGWGERAVAGGDLRVNAFDQYVPGFGITFLLIAMLMGLSLGLIDDRDWGTLQRLRVSSAPLGGILTGKLLSRFLIGLVQLILLFVAGWLLFGVSLGRDPILLLIPATAISFAAAAFALVIASLARTHDSVMPIGAVVSMAMSAIGGCWWPLDFEPHWMRVIALWLPTTWTMRAFNDLTMRGLGASSVLRSSAIAAGLGVIYLIAGFIGASRQYR